MRKKLRKFWNKNIVSFGILVLVIDIFLQIYFRMVGFGISNLGVSFGMFKETGSIMAALFWTFLVGFLILERVRRKTLNRSIVLIVLGGLGNIVGRMVGGEVWDYIYLPIFPFWFNLSDVLITLGVVSYILGSNGDSDTI